MGLPILIFALALLAASLLGAASAPCDTQALSNPQKQSRVQELNLAAESAMQGRQFESAVQFYAEAACLVPESAREFYGLGVAQAAGGNFLAARKSLGTADTLEPTNVLPLTMLVRVNVSMGDGDSLKATLRAIAERFPNRSEVHSLLSRFFLENGQTDLALAESLRAHKAGETKPEFLVELAALENSAGTFSDAFHKSMQIEQQEDLPASIRASAAGIAGLSLQSMGRSSEAIEHLRHAITLDPSSENSYRTLAFVYEKAGNDEAAVNVLDKAHRAFPSSVDVTLLFGTDLIKAQAYQRGIAVLQEAIKGSPDQLDAYMQIANGYHQMANISGEVQTLQEIARRKPDYPMIHLLIVRALLAQDPPDYGKALSELQLAEKAAPTDADVFYLRGKIYLALARQQEAVTAFRQSIDLRPSEPSAYYQLAQLYRKMGKPELAREYFERVQFIQQNAR